MGLLSELDKSSFRGWIEDLWGIRVRKICREIQIQGSPERSLSRAVFEDKNGTRFLLEKFAKEKYRIRQRVARTLAYLNKNGLSGALAPEPAFTGEFLPFFEGDCFQITLFLDSTGVQRPQWLASGDIGDGMAGFLIDMRRASGRITQGISYPPFSIKDYIYKLFRDMQNHNPGAHSIYLPILEFLEKGFMSAQDRLDLQFCHGDFHPLNVIWDNHRIKAVIDWEFTGMKPDCYDAANLVGCAGIEHPEGLAMPMVTTFLSRIREAGLVSNWEWFPEYILALRFAWLSEWLRTQDDEMLETEFSFMNILIRHMDELREVWDLKNKFSP
jgi:homoserine kinase type II